MKTFAQEYFNATMAMQHDTSYRVNFACRGLKIGREMHAACAFDMSQYGVSIFSGIGHRVVPIKFILAELCWMLGGKGDVESIASYNKSMAHYSNDGITIGGAYGVRLRLQLPKLIERLKEDMYTRQACASIFEIFDCVDVASTHMPCNVFLQFICRPPLLNLHVTSRSSDFVTGFSIDTLHWQALLILMANELKASGMHVIPNMLMYNIASLHVYKADCDMVDAWDNKVVAFEHIVPIVGNMTLSEAIASCQANFKKDLSLPQLMDVLGMGTSSLSTMVLLDEMFKHHKNKVVR